MPENPNSGFFSVNTLDGETTAYHDGEVVQTYRQAPPAVPRPARRTRPGNPDYFIGPKLKIERAKRHIHELEAAIQAFHQSNPYELLSDQDPHTGENIFRVSIKKSIPTEISPIIGDVAHNLRCVLDYLVCDCIRAADGMPDGNSGLPVKREAKRLKPGSVPKIEGVSPRAERFFLRLKGSAGINGPLYKLHMLDVIDKHNAIVTVAAATVKVTAKVGVPGIFLSAEGALCIGGGDRPFLIEAGTPSNFFQVFPLNDNVEIHRSPAGFYEEVETSISITFGQGQITEGEPVLETLVQLADFVERVIGVCERQCR